MHDLLVTGGLLVTPQSRARINLATRDGRISYLGPDEPEARERVDATGLLVLPGGVDTHVHLMDPGSTEREDFPTGTKAAALAGVTTIVEHTHAQPVRTVDDLTSKVDYLSGRAHVDFGLAAHAWPGYGAHLPGLWRAGIAFVKVFTCTTHGVPGHTPDLLQQHLRTAADHGIPSLIHCEDETLTAAAEKELRGAGRTDGALVTEWRSREAELVAVNTAALLVRLTGARATLAHLSHPAAVELAQRERALGADLTMEACPQYFLLREDELDAHGALRKFTPPARSRHQADEDDMWALLRHGGLSLVSSDHAPSTMEQKCSHDLWQAPFGLPGLDTTMSILIDAACNGKLAWEDVARLYAEAPARRYGLWRRKGALRLGFDADLILVDPTRERTLRREAVTSKAGWSPYEGRTFQGQVVRTVLRGRTVALEGELVTTSQGQWLPGGGHPEVER